MSFTRSYRRFYFYIGKEFIISFLVAFAFFFFIFFVNNILFFAKTFAEKDISFHQIFLLLIYGLPYVVFLSSPFAALLGCLMALGRLSSDNEIMAIQCVGISMKRTYFPIFICSVFFFILAFLVNDVLLPLGEIRFNSLFIRLLETNPNLVLTPNSIKAYQNAIILTGNKVHNRYNSISILDIDSNDNPRFIVAKSARLIPHSQKNGLISVSMAHPFIFSANKTNYQEFQYYFAKKVSYNIVLRDLSMDSNFEIDPSGMTARDVNNGIKRLKKQYRQDLAAQKTSIEKLNYIVNNLYTAVIANPSNAQYHYSLTQSFNLLVEKKKYKPQNEELNLWISEFYQKFMMPLMCISFVLLAFPIGIFNKRMKRSIGFILGIGISIFFWCLWVLGRTAIADFNFSPFIGIWGPFFLILFIGLFLFILRLIRRGV